MKGQDHVAALRQWAEWGKRCVPKRASLTGWSAVDDLIKAAAPRLLEDSSTLRDLLERSSSQLKLSDPLLNDLGVHRWLDKETSYSDWLAWVLERLGDASVVLDVLGIRDPQFASICAGKHIHVQCEAQVKKGLPRSKGRIDLLIRFGEPLKALLGVEVKTDDEQYEKQQGYIESLRKLCPNVECVLVANCEPSADELGGFKLRQWKEVSIALRRAIARYVQNHEDRSVAAMMLGFVAAIEQNLLGFGSVAAHRAWRKQPVLLERDLSEYLKEALEVA